MKRILVVDESSNLYGRYVNEARINPAIAYRLHHHTNEIELTGC